MNDGGVIILGIDPGSHHLGIGFLHKRGHQLKLLHADTLNAPAKAPFFDRLEILHKQLKPLVLKWKPQEVAIEDVFSAKSPRSAFRLGIARGVALSACLGMELKFFEYAPTQVKSVVTGFGRADKSQVQKMVGLTLGMKLDLGFDATDAIAVAICHAFSVRILTTISKESKTSYDRIPSRKSIE